MTRRWAVAVALLLAAVSVSAQSRGAVDWILLVDTSASMRGVGGTKNIFADVKESVSTFIREASDGDSISVYSFDREVEFRGSSDIRGTFDRNEMLKIVDRLSADGNRTYLGGAIAHGLDRSEAMLQRNDSTRTRTVVLFTDGKEDVRGVPDPVSIGSNIQRVQTSKPWIFFVSMGDHEAQLDAFANDETVHDRTKVLRPRDAIAIRQAAGDIRIEIAKGTAGTASPKPADVGFTPALLAFGALQLGERTDERELTITADKPVSVAIALTPDDGVSAPALERIAVAPAAPARVRLQLTAAREAAPGPRPLTFTIAAAAGEPAPFAPIAVPATVSLTKPSMLLRIAKWLGALAVLLLLALIALVVYSGKMPGELFGAFQQRKHLEGEIEIVAPRMPIESASIGLPGMKASEIALSSIVPLDALAGSDARLFCRRNRGEKAVWIAANGGTIRVNDVEVPASELFDADTIRVGNATLRFNRLGHSRASDDSYPV